MKWFLIILLMAFTFLAHSEEVKVPKEIINKVKEIKSDFNEKAKELKNQIKAQVQIMDELLASDATEEKINEEFKKLKDLRGRHQDLRLNHILMMRKILPPEQRQYLKMMKGSHSELRGHTGYCSDGE
ncbi:MAG: hypothetical protein CO099_13620 [Bdellovibrio sp. CG_4_9_14_3_um_filter_39_7]|nr:MAG: hypothetical protein CO099_13620 [Bdellovibrio sp. CG_4_9_14_3_um_filter_39_7]